MALAVGGVRLVAGGVWLVCRPQRWVPLGQMIKDVRVSSYGHVFERFAERSRYFLAEVWSVV